VVGLGVVSSVEPAPPLVMPVVSVLYFAALRDLAGTSKELVSLPAVPLSVASLLQALEERHSALSGRLASVRVAVDEEFAEKSRELRGGEVVALIPPVSGG
jgi:molybdopterin converting factor subunit 1